MKLSSLRHQCFIFMYLDISCFVIYLCFVCKLMVKRNIIIFNLFFIIFLFRDITRFESNWIFQCKINVICIKDKILKIIVRSFEFVLDSGFLSAYFHFDRILVCFLVPSWEAKLITCSGFIELTSYSLVSKHVIS